MSEQHSGETEVSPVYFELVFDRALEAIASGLSKTETRGAIVALYPRVGTYTVRCALDEALEEALLQGVEREDIDGSWFN